MTNRSAAMNEATSEEGFMFRSCRLATSVLFLALAATPAILANGQTIGPVEVIEVRDWSGPTRTVLAVSFDAGATIEVPPAACATGAQGLSYAFDLKLSQGKVAYGVAETALVTGLTLRIIGTGQCTLIAGIEDGLGILLFAP